MNKKTNFQLGYTYLCIFGYDVYALLSNLLFYGKCTEAEHQANRRTEFKILKKW